MVSRTRGVYLNVAFWLPIRGFATGVSAEADIGAAALTQLSFTST